MAVLSTNEMMFQAFEPKVKNRFIMHMNDIPAFMVKKVSAPGFEDGVIKLDHINSYRKLRGKREWKDMSMTLYNPIAPAGSQAVMEWARTGYESLTGRAGYAADYKQDLTLNILGPPGDVIGEWVIKGAFIKDMAEGDYDWSSADAAEITMTVAMDYCVLNF